MGLTRQDAPKAAGLRRMQERLRLVDQENLVPSGSQVQDKAQVAPDTITLFFQFRKALQAS
jgi:hypothetical protein